ncbi:EAL domain-containing protein [Roseibium sp.]|uniref:bifunctional diguanylate cyclase/phosphodiesterase n=1 Tax=Roseibium sp. TaxID=1936156 RepID=UPI003B52A535
MKIRSYVVFCFLLAALLPTVVFSTWSYRETVSREFSEVKDRHLLLAQKAAATLDHYHHNLVAAVEAVGKSLMKSNGAGEYAKLFDQLKIKGVIISYKTGGQVIYSAGENSVDTVTIPKTVLAGLIETAEPGKPSFSDITATAAGENLIYLTLEKSDRFLIGLIAPDYIVALGKSIVFGEKGHAAIVDRSGNVIAHPRDQWMKSRKNIASLSIVGKMMNGETGIEEFYSPAVERTMIAGFTTVQGPGWGVMVPQPVSEIYAKADQVHASLIPTIAIALVLIFAIGLFLARSLSRPIEELAGAMHKGALDQKLSPLHMPRSLVQFQENKEVCESYNRLVQRMTLANDQIEKLAFSDHVTGLPNRKHLQLRASAILKEAGEPKRGGVILLVDLDNFKEINDLHGHHTGDQHLKNCAQILSKVADDVASALQGPKPYASPIVARIGGDEFIVLIQGLMGDQAIRAFLNTVQAALSKPVPELNITPGASIGCAQFPSDGVELKELLKRADIAMYHAKRSGKNRTQVYSPLIGTKSIGEIRRELTAAIETGGLFLEYQPKICTKRRTVISVEALARWNHPELGLFLPKFWVPTLMGSHTMSRLGEWVVATAMRDLAAIRAEGHDLWMSVNIGSDHFVTGDFADKIEAIRSDQKFSAEHLEFEVTEDTLFNSEERAVQAFNRLHSLGYKISIDDFGIGYSNITRLANLPVDFLKIDQSIIAGASKDPRIRTILASTIAMAKDLDCATVAEGIETNFQAEFATQLGANCLQGYYFTGSLPLDKLLVWLDEQPGPTGHSYLRETDDKVA